MWNRISIGVGNLEAPKPCYHTALTQVYNSFQTRLQTIHLDVIHTTQQCSLAPIDPGSKQTELCYIYFPKGIVTTGFCLLDMVRLQDILQGLRLMIMLQLLGLGRGHTFGSMGPRKHACASLHLQYLLYINAALLVLGFAVAVDLGRTRHSCTRHGPSQGVRGHTAHSKQTYDKDVNALQLMIN